MPNFIIYMYPGACSRVTMTALEEAGVDYEDRAVDLGGGGQNSPEYTALNRMGKVPMLVIGDQSLTENAAILAYLDQTFPDAKLLPRSASTVENARAVSDVIWCASTLHPIVRQIRAPFKWTLDDPAGVHADGMKKMAKECDYISERVGADGWWYGRDWSIVDVYLYWAYSTAAKGGFLIDDYPMLTAHAERVRARPSFKRALAREIAAISRDGLPLVAADL